MRMLLGKTQKPAVRLFDGWRRSGNGRNLCLYQLRQGKKQGLFVAKPCVDRGCGGPGGLGYRAQRKPLGAMPPPQVLGCLSDSGFKVLVGNSRHIPDSADNLYIVALT